MTERSIESERRQYWPLLAVLCGLVAVNAILVSLINVSLPAIREDFNVGPGSLSWAASAYIIAGAIGAIIYGRIADSIGLRKALIGCLCAFLPATLGVVLAPSFLVLVLFRIPQGFFGMALPALAMAAVARILPQHLQAWAMGAIIAAFGLGLLAGSVPGGIGVDLASWRLPFLLTGVYALLLLPPALRLIPTRSDLKPLGFDYVGGVLVAGAVGTTLVGVNQLPGDFSSRLGLASLVATVPLWALFLAWIQRRHEPFVRPELLRNAAFLRICLVGGVAQSVFVGSGFVIPLLLRDVFDASFVTVGFYLAPGFVAVTAIGMVAGRLSARFGTRPALICLTFVFLGMSILFSQWAAGENRLALIVVYTIMGALYAGAQAWLLPAVARYLPRDQVATGVGFYNFSYFAGGAFTVAVAGGVLEHRVGALDSWGPFISGPQSGYADSVFVLVVLSLIGLLVALGLRRNAPALPEAADEQRSANVTTPALRARE
ncbi:MAG: MFS transporter [Dehalococcoidia bacterium]|nr:MFS transporter [Dehalococcoidia bacterium]